MKLLYADRVARWVLLRAIGMLAQLVTKWSKHCDKALHRLMCYVHSSTEVTMINHVGQSDTLDETELNVYADADLAGERPTYKSPAGYIGQLWGPNTMFNFAAKSKTIGGVCNSTPEAEMSSANMALKQIGFPTLDLLEVVCDRKVILRW